MGAGARLRVTDAKIRDQPWSLIMRVPLSRRRRRCFCYDSCRHFHTSIVVKALHESTMTTDFADLRRQIAAGDVLLPGEDGYKESLKRWSQSAERPAVRILLCTSSYLPNLR